MAYVHTHTQSMRQAHIVTYTPDRPLLHACIPENWHISASDKRHTDTHTGLPHFSAPDNVICTYLHDHARQSTYADMHA